jgi:hypothetical protein
MCFFLTRRDANAVSISASVLAFQDDEFHAQSLRASLCIFDLRLKAWSRWIGKETD